MPKSRTDPIRTARRVRHDPLERGRDGRDAVVPALAKLGTGPDAPPVATGDKVWALASVATLFADEKNRRTLLSSGVVQRVVYALESDTNLEVRREAGNALRTLCVDGGSGVQTSVAEHGGVEAILRCLRWAALGLQSTERRASRAQPQEEERARLLAKPAEQMNRKERRHAAKLAAGKPLPPPPGADFSVDDNELDPAGWAADAPRSLAAMEPNAAQCLVEMCESLVTTLNALCDASEHVLMSAALWDWRDNGKVETTKAVVGDNLAAWLCQAVELGILAARPADAATAPLCTTALLDLGVSAANALCALSDEDRTPIALGIAGLPAPPSKSRRAPIPPPSELQVLRTHGERRLAAIARAAELLPIGAEPPVPALVPRISLLGALASGVLSNVLAGIHESVPDIDAVCIDAHDGSGRIELAPGIVEHVLPRLLQTVSEDPSGTLIGTETLEIALEVVAEIMNRIGTDAESEEPEEPDWADMEEDSAPGAMPEQFVPLLSRDVLGLLLRLGAPDAAPLAVQMRALAAANNLLLQVAAHSPPPPSQWPEDPEDLERIDEWRALVGTAFLSGGDAAPSELGALLHEVWAGVFAIAAHWAGDASVVQGGAGADDGLTIVDTCIGCLWSLARILEGQVDVVDGSGPAPVVSALVAVYHAAQLDSIRVKAINTLAVLARSQVYRIHGSDAPPAPYTEVSVVIGDFLVDVCAHGGPNGGTSADGMVAAVNAVVDLYSDERAPWDHVYRERSYQSRLASLVPRLGAQVKAIDRRDSGPLRAAASESVSNLRAFLEYRQSV